MCVLGVVVEVQILSLPQHEHLLETPNPLFVSAAPSPWITMTTPIHIMAEDWLYSFTWSIITEHHALF